MKEKFQVEELQTYQTNPDSSHHSVVNASLDSLSNNSNLLVEMASGHSGTKLKYGNFKVLYQNQRFLFTIGPDYIFFAISYIFLTLMGLTIIYLSAVQINNIFLNVINVVCALFQNFSYLVVALSNPGIQTANTINTDEDQTDQFKRFCKKCSIRMRKGTYHCRYCDVCIRNYDHHCPWTSKCIGEKNLSKFYVFFISTSIYLTYCFVMLLIFGAEMADKLKTL